MEASDFYCEQVLRGAIHVRKVLETENVLACHHSRPSYRVHIVVIPKRHTLDFLTASEDDPVLLSEVLSVAARVMRQVMREHGGCRLTTNVGTCQQTKHLHWHVYVSDDIMGSASHRAGDSGGHT